MILGCIGLLAAPQPLLAYGLSAESGIPQYQDYTQKDYTGADAGYVVLSLADDDHDVGMRHFRFTAATDDLTSLPAFEVDIAGIFGTNKQDYVDRGLPTGIVVRALKPGDYTLNNYDATSGPNCNHQNFAAHLQVHFTVKAGQTTYLGNFVYQPLTWHTIFGAACSNGGYFVVTDKSAQDLPLAKAKVPALPDARSLQVLDAAALKLPLFQAAELATPRPSPTALDTENELRDAGELVGKDNAKAEPILRKIIASGDLWQSTLAYAHANLGVALASRHAVDEAIAEFGEGIRLDPDLQAAWGDRGWIRFSQHDVEGAYTDTKMAVHLQPRWTLWHLHLGEIEMARNHSDLAMLQFDDARALSPDSPRPYLERAYANQKLERYADAIADIDAGVKAGALKPEDASAVRCAVGIKAGLGAGVLADCDKVIAKRPGNVDALLGRGLARLALAQPAAAAEDFDAARKAKPTSAFALYGRGMAKKALGDAGAQADIDGALKESPDIAKRFEAFAAGVPAAPPPPAPIDKP